MCKLLSLESWCWSQRLECLRGTMSDRRHLAHPETTCRGRKLCCGMILLTETLKGFVFCFSLPYFFEHTGPSPVQQLIDDRERFSGRLHGWQWASLKWLGWIGVWWNDECLDVFFSFFFLFGNCYLSARQCDKPACRMPPVGVWWCVPWSTCSMMSRHHYHFTSPGSLCSSGLPSRPCAGSFLSRGYEAARLRYC